MKKDTSFEIFDYRKQAEFKRRILNDNPMEQKVLDATFCLSTVISFLSHSLSYMAHSYILNKEKARLNLNGFTNIYQTPVQWPPTCIGQQLSEELVLYPNNKHFQQVVDYLLLGHLVIEELKKPPLFDVLLPKTKQRINSFPIMFKDETILENRFMSPA